MAFLDFHLDVMKTLNASDIENTASDNTRPVEYVAVMDMRKLVNDVLKILPT